MKRRHVPLAALAAGLQRQRAGLTSAPFPEPSRSARRAAAREARKARPLYHPLAWRAADDDNHK